MTTCFMKVDFVFDKNVRVLIIPYCLGCKLHLHEAVRGN